MNQAERTGEMWARETFNQWEQALSLYSLLHRQKERKERTLSSSNQNSESKDDKYQSWMGWVDMQTQWETWFLSSTKASYDASLIFLHNSFDCVLFEFFSSKGSNNERGCLRKNFLIVSPRLSQPYWRDSCAVYHLPSSVRAILSVSEREETQELQFTGRRRRFPIQSLPLSARNSDGKTLLSLSTNVPRVHFPFCMCKIPPLQSIVEVLVNLYIL